MKKRSRAFRGWIATGLTLAAFAARAFDPQALEQEINLATDSPVVRNAAREDIQRARLGEMIGRSNFVARMLPPAMESGDAAEITALLNLVSNDVARFRLNGRLLLPYAAERGHAEAVKALLARGLPPDLVDNSRTYYGPSGSTPLRLAVEKGFPDAAAALLDGGARVDATNSIRGTPLEWVVQSGSYFSGMNRTDAEQTQLELAEILTSHGASVTSQSRMYSGQSLVEMALSRNSRTALGEILLTNATDLAARTAGGDTLLHIAVRWGKTGALATLLRRHADANATNAYGLTPLHVAALMPRTNAPRTLAGGTRVPAGQAVSGGPIQTFASGSSMQIIQGQVSYFGGGPYGSSTFATIATKRDAATLLLDGGARLDLFAAAGLGRTNDLAAQLEPATRIEETDRAGRTPLHWAALAGETGAVNWLLARGANVAAPISGWPPASQVRDRRSGTPQRADYTYSTYRSAGFDYSTYAPAGQQPLHVAVAQGFGDIVAILLNARAPIDAASATGDTPLHIAAARGDTNIVAQLLGAGATINRLNQEFFSPLGVAVRQHQGAIAQQLLVAKASVTNGAGASNTLVHLAAVSGYGPILDDLLRRGLAVDARDGQGRTPFHLATTAAGSLDNARLLLKRGADINARDRDGNTALHLAAQVTYDQIYLAPAPPWWAELTARWSWTRAPLNWLATRGVIKSAAVTGMMPMTNRFEFLLDQGAKPSVTNNAGQTPLHALVSREDYYNSSTSTNQLRAMRRLVRAGVKPDARDVAGRTALHAAIERRNLFGVTNLVTAGVLIDTPDARGRTAVHYAATNELYSPNLVTGLVELKANVNIRDAQGRTPLHLALISRQPRQEVMKALLDQKADPSLRDNDGRTPVQLGLAQGRLSYSEETECIRQLLAAQTAPPAPDNAGNSLLHLLAANTNETYISTDLLDRIVGASGVINATNRAGDTALHLAVRAKNRNLIDQLQRKGADASIPNAQGETPRQLALTSFGGAVPDSLRPANLRMDVFAAVANGDAGLVQEWLKLKPELIRASDTGGRSMLRIASDARQTNLFETLLAAGAPLDARAAAQMGRTNQLAGLLESQSDLKTSDALGDLIHNAIDYGQLASVTLLADAGADLTRQDLFGQSPLHHAGTRRQGEIVKLLKARGAKENFFDAIAHTNAAWVKRELEREPALASKPDRAGRSPLQHAVPKAGAEIARLLIEHGADPWSRDSHGKTLLHVAAGDASPELLKVLLPPKAEVDVGDRFAFTPLHYAVTKTNTEAVRLLLARGANPDGQPSSVPGSRSFEMDAGNTPLHQAVLSGNVEIAKILLAAKADPNAINRARQTPIQLIKQPTSVRHYLNTSVGHTYRASPILRNGVLKQELTDLLRANGARD